MPAPHRLPCEIPAPHPPTGEPSTGTRWVLPATILGSSLSFIDGSVVNVALPALQRSLDADFATLQWVVNGYMLALASLILLGGSAGDRFGQRQVFLIGLIGFAVASLACAVAPAASWLIGARVTQGVAAALLMPASLAIIGKAYTGPSRGAAIGTWAAAGALTTALGPPLGGWLVDTVGWRAIFVINLPIAALACLFGMRLPTDRGERTGGPLDVAGAVLAVVTLAALSYGLIAIGEGNRRSGLIAAAAALPAGWLFVRAERRSPAPMMDTTLFRDANFAGANALTVLLYAALSAGMFLIPFKLIEVYGYSATMAGAAFLPFSAVMAIGSRWTGGLVARVGFKLPLMLGPLAAALGYVLLGVLSAGGGYWTSVLPGLFVVAIGTTISVAPLTTAVFNSAPPERSGVASGINNAAARTGGMMAVAALGLAFGAAGDGGGATLAGAYRVVMFGCAGLAAASTLTAALTLRARPTSAGGVQAR